MKQITSDALERPESERPSWLAGVCSGDEALRREVESLLAAHARAGDFLETPGLARDGAAEAVATTALQGAMPIAAGRGIGSYRIIRELGQGGMGVVYLAERADAAFEKKVAIKVIRGGFASGPSMTQRFHDERRILATLDHPNIARLLDAGSTDDGLPYFVMEYVDGIPLDAYCETTSLSLGQRLALFQEVCAAVQYAHQRLVIHRDLKARNILVTADGTPKLLDFGIAKLLEPGLAPEEQTRTGVRPLSLEGASPEQLRGEPMTVTSDVYSLGVLLYRLLTGQSPYGPERLTDASLIRAICEEAPARPSTAATKEERRELSGELDWIVLKALRKEPDRRYTSVEHFTEDIGRYLEGRPVLAAPDTLRYRTAKFIRRHVAGVVSAALVLLSLVGGIAATTRQARIADVNRRRAETRFSEVRALARSYIFEIHDAIRDLEGSTKARETIVKRALEYLDRLARESGDDTSLLEEVASGYERIGEVQGGRADSNLGDVAGGIESLRKALTIRRDVFRSHPGSVDAAVKLALGHCLLAGGLASAGRSAEALESVRPARAILEPLAIERMELARLLEVANAWSRMGELLRLAGDTTASLDVLQRGETFADRAYAVAPGSADAIGALISARIGLSDALRQMGRRPEALAGLRRVHGMAERFSAADPSHGQMKFSLTVLSERIADLLGELGEVEGSLDMRHKALALAEGMAVADPQDARARFARFVCYYKLGIDQGMKKDWKAAIVSQERALALAEPEVAADPSNTWTRHLMAGAYLERGEALARSGSHGPALASYRKALEIDRALADQDPKNAEYAESLSDTYTRAARSMTAAAEPAQAIEALKKALALIQPLAAAEPANTFRKSTLAKVQAGLGGGWAQLAKQGGHPAGSIHSARREACAAYERSALLWKEHEAIAPLTAPDVTEAMATARASERCAATFVRPLAP